MKERKQLDITDLIASIQDRVRTGTGMKCLDHVGKNEKSPFYYTVFNGDVPVNSKTMYVKDYNVLIHVISEPSDSSVPVYGYIRKLQEAMSEDIALPEGFTLVMQTDNGVRSIKTDETNEKHAVCAYTFRVSYGFKCKV